MTNLMISFCVHAGCRYNYLDPTVNKGWDVAALPDAVSDYQGSCGRCYEIGCAPMHLKVRLAQLGMSQALVVNVQYNIEYNSVRRTCATSSMHALPVGC